jgi:hypothetical protein
VCGGDNVVEYEGTYCKGFSHTSSDNKIDVGFSKRRNQGQTVRCKMKRCDDKRWGLIRRSSWVSVAARSVNPHVLAQVIVTAEGLIATVICATESCENEL